jgi:hypothetical protein
MDVRQRSPCAQRAGRVLRAFCVRSWEKHYEATKRSDSNDHGTDVLGDCRASRQRGRPTEATGFLQYSCRKYQING